jgi:hypothetical protein
MKRFLKQLTTQFMHSPIFFMDRIQIIFALLLVCIIFLIAYITIEPSAPKSPQISPSDTQAPQKVTSTGQNGSFNIQPNRAVALVENLKEIQAAASASASDHTKFTTEIDSYPTVQNNFYFIHAYEIVSDGNGNSHTATVGWYKVDPQTGSVTKSEGL